MTQKHGTPKKTEPEQPDLATRITEHPYFRKLVEHKTVIPYVSIGILIVLFFSFKFFTGRTANTESNYLLASNYFSMIQRSIQESHAGPRDQALIKLKTITDDYPELQSRYDALIAQLLITQNQPKEALPYAQRTFSRTKDNNLTFYTDFSTTTLLIAEGDHAQALERSRALKDQLLATTEAETSQSKPAFGDTLFAYNLLRIAMLSKELSSPQEELAAWEEWNSYPNSTFKPEAFAKLNDHIGEENFSLQQYIDIRKKAIEKDNLPSQERSK